jgi:hypothetical protein
MAVLLDSGFCRNDVMEKGFLDISNKLFDSYPTKN